MMEGLGKYIFLTLYKTSLNLMNGNTQYLFLSFQTSYRNIFLMVNKLLQKLSEVFDFHTWNFSAVSKLLFLLE